MTIFAIKLYNASRSRQALERERALRSGPAAVRQLQQVLNRKKAIAALNIWAKRRMAEAPEIGFSESEIQAADGIIAEFRNQIEDLHEAVIEQNREAAEGMTLDQVIRRDLGDRWFTIMRAGQHAWNGTFAKISSITHGQEAKILDSCGKPL